MPVQSQIERLREDYRRRTELVETARAEEIAALTDERAWQIIRTLKPFAFVPDNPDNGSGLVEQQRLFGKLQTK
jgi:hypothetical protein